MHHGPSIEGHAQRENPEDYDKQMHGMLRVHRSSAAVLQGIHEVSIKVLQRFRDLWFRALGVRNVTQI